MSEDFENEEEMSQEDAGEQSIWDMLQLEDPGDDPFEEEEEEQDESDAKTSKIAKKLSAKMDDMSKKFENTILLERTKAFQRGASELEVSLFKTVVSDVKTLADFDKAVALVKDRSVKMQAEADKYLEQMEATAAAQAANAWGTGPVGTPQRRTPDAEEESFKKIQDGDIRELELSLNEDAPWMQ
jgi:hypothetical protein